MRYEVDVEEYGTTSLEAIAGNVLLQLRSDENSMMFEFTPEEFDTFNRAVTNAKNDLARA